MREEFRNANKPKTNSSTQEHQTSASTAKGHSSEHRVPPTMYVCQVPGNTWAGQTVPWEATDDDPLAKRRDTPLV